MAYRKTLVGIKFGRLTPIKKIRKHGDGSTKTTYLCNCECGSEIVVRYSNLMNGTSTSCGCTRTELLRKRNRKGTGLTAMHSVWTYYRRNARVRELDWNLTKEQFVRLVRSPCSYCGHIDSMVTTVRHGDKCAHNGIDRENNALGYSLKNSTPCCNICNRAKSDMSRIDFIKWTNRFKDR